MENSVEDISTYNACDHAVVLARPHNAESPLVRDQLKTGAVEMKVFTDAPLHGKAYIFHRPQDPHVKKLAYVGSSNLTGAGLMRNLELNIDVLDQDAARKLAQAA